MPRKRKHFFGFLRKNFKNLIYLFILLIFIFSGSFFLWITTMGLPNLNNFEERRVAQSTKIYDRTGQIVLYDVFGQYKRTVVPLSEMSDYIKKATISIEDKNFYKHGGIEIMSIFRAILNNIKEGNVLGGQGGSTITQQVIKNALLTRDKTITRKIKEWVLAPKLEKTLSKDQILEVYLNEIPYGGSVYGIQEASLRFFGKNAKDLSLVESAYLAALPQAPTLYSPYGNNLDKLESRKNKVLFEMKQNGYITEEEYQKAIKEKVDFQKQENYSIKAPHFVMYIIEKLEKEYGKDVVQEGGLKVITTLDWSLQEKAEEIVKKHALENKKVYNAENGSITAIDPKNGDILVMVGSRDFFDKEIDGNYNISLAERQPGSAFKPIVYAEAFNKGYHPETVVFDLPTEFSTTCNSGGECYNPENYDHIFRGPISLRNALAQSINIPAIKVLYLAGLKDSLDLAKKMGLETLTNVNQYGLTLVLGGGEVRPIDMAFVYGVFANDGIKNKERNILKIEDNKGKTLFESKDEDIRGERILSEQTSRLISDVLSDNTARTPAFGSNSYLNFPNQQVAVKTGTTNDYKDAWIVGYTPNISVVAWAGNNNNTSMEKKVAGFIVAPMWNEFMQLALQQRPVESFYSPEPISQDLKPIIKGDWKSDEIHSILYWVDKSDPLGPPPSNPRNDPQFNLWEESVIEWSKNQKNIITTPETNTEKNELRITTIENGKSYLKNEIMVIAVEFSDKRKVKSGDVFLNNKKIGELDPVGNAYSFYPNKTKEIKSNNNKILVKVFDESGNSFESIVNFDIN